MWALLSLQLACTGTPADTADTAGTDAEKWDGLDTPGFELEATPEELVAELETLLQWGLPDAGTIRDHYDELMTYGDAEAGGCPGAEHTLDDDVVRGCFAESGWFYSGISTWMEQDVETEEGPALNWFFTGELWITSPKDLTFTVAGDVSHRSNDFGAVEEIRGSWVSELHGGWLGSGVSAWLDHTVEDGSQVLAGTLSVAGVYVELVELTRGPRFGSCTEEQAEGQLRIRDASSRWVDWEVGCYGCGPVSLDGEVLAESVCFDLVPALEDLASTVTSR